MPSLISAHIEKTGGTSLYRAYKEIYGPEKVFLYFPQSDTVAPAIADRLSGSTTIIDVLKSAVSKTFLYPHLYPQVIKIRKLISDNHSAEQLPPGFGVVHGHFQTNRFDHLVGEGAVRSIVLRNPLERMISHYERWKRTRGQDLSRLFVQYNKNMSFEQFSLLPRMQNYQAGFLAGKDLKEFYIVGVTERLDEFGTNLQKVLAFSKRINIAHLNQSPPLSFVSPQDLPNKFIREFEDYHQIDYDLYNQALNISMRTGFL